MNTAFFRVGRSYSEASTQGGHTMTLTLYLSDLSRFLSWISEANWFRISVFNLVGNPGNMEVPPDSRMHRYSSFRISIGLS